MKWHDGTTMSMADILLGLALSFDRPQKDSAIFDESEAPSFNAFMKYFKGVRIVQENPLVVEVYSDQTYLDAEWIADSAAGYFYTSTPWQMLAPGILAETNHELAFSSSKADDLKVEWMSYIAGPSLPILEKYRQQALQTSYIPYANFLGKYISAKDISDRYTALGSWYQKTGHFWVGNGPYYIDSVHPVQKTIVLKRFQQYLGTDSKWLAFTSPRIADVTVSGPAQVHVGAGAEFQVNIKYNGQPYAINDIDFIKFLLFSGSGTLIASGDAQAVRDGLWKIVLTGDQSKQLQIGSNKIEVIVTPKVVSVSSTGSFTFAVVP
jgi:peptide/nickel transport system substrate-binding protein